MKSQSRPVFLGFLWLVVLLAPVAWSVALGAMFPLTDWVCEHGSRTVLFAVGGSCLAAAIAATLLGWSCRTTQTAERSRFMLELGIGMGAMFALVIFFYVVPVFLLRSCPI